MRLLRWIVLALLPLLAGCFAERSFPMVSDHLAHMPAGDRLPARRWAATMHTRAADRLPLDRRDALTTDQLASGDSAVNVWQHFNLNPATLDNLFLNSHGIEESAQSTSPPPVMKGGHVDRLAWQGFHDVEVPVGNGVMLYARLGDPDHDMTFPLGADYAGTPKSYIILTHGLFGSLDGYDIENHAQALRKMGHHVLALEMRGHGETYCRHPEYAITFGILETGDLIATDRWLRKTQGATRVGLVCFSLTGQEALLTAWLDGKSPVTDFNGVPFLKDLPTRSAGPAFDAGMFIVSAPVGIVGLADGFDHRYSAFDGPVKASFQDRVAQRLALYKDHPGFSMWDLARCEFSRSGLAKDYPSFDVARADFLRFVDFSADGWRGGAARLENARVPLLVLSAADDPLASAQNVAELFSRQQNPNIGVIMLKEGGHMGFTALSADYYYSLMMNFFDPMTGPVAQ